MGPLSEEAALIPVRAVCELRAGVCSFFFRAPVPLRPTPIPLVKEAGTTQAPAEASLLVYLLGATSVAMLCKKHSNCLCSPKVGLDSMESGP